MTSIIRIHFCLQNEFCILPSCVLLFLFFSFIYIYLPLFNSNRIGMAPYIVACVEAGSRNLIRKREKRISERTRNSVVDKFWRERRKNENILCVSIVPSRWPVATYSSNPSLCYVRVLTVVFILSGRIMCRATHKKNCVQCTFSVRSLLSRLAEPNKVGYA